MSRLLIFPLVLGALLVASSCSQDERHPIVVEPTRVVVTNLTDVAWTDVDVWLNDHYRVQAERLDAGGRLDIPIGVFIAGFGQRFDPKRQTPFGVEVSAKTPDGKPVVLTWGKGRRR